MAELEGSIAIATTTFYKNWYPGITLEDSRKTDKVRGDLALQMAKESLNKGFQLVVVDGSSSESFRQNLTDLGAAIYPEKERGMSGARRTAIRTAAELPGVDILAWVEPEKVSMPRDCLPECVMPILHGEADVLIPQRDEAGFASYPAYQAASDKRANSLFGGILKSRHILSENQTGLGDLWLGPIFFRNDKNIVNLYLREYGYRKSENSALDKIVDPEKWPNTQFFPIVNALVSGFKVEGVTVDYRHPVVQTEMEDRPEDRRKRDTQVRGIITAVIHLVRLLEGDLRSRLYQVRN